jgi:hypothetical protein
MFSECMGILLCFFYNFFFALVFVNDWHDLIAGVLQTGKFSPLLHIELMMIVPPGIMVFVQSLY